jgi:hypothetical protein
MKNLHPSIDPKGDLNHRKVHDVMQMHQECGADIDANEGLAFGSRMMGV